MSPSSGGFWIGRQLLVNPKTQRVKQGKNAVVESTQIKEKKISLQIFSLDLAQVGLFTLGTDKINTKGEKYRN